MTQLREMPGIGDDVPEPADPAANGEAPPPRPPPVARPLSTLLRPTRNDTQELLRNRYLCRGAGLLLCGPTGIGKSSLTLQCAILWAIGKPAFGMVPTGPLRSLIIQAENDDGDLAEMRDGIIAGLNLSPEDAKRATDSIIVVREDTRTGYKFFCEVVRPLLAEHKPDLLFIDPALAYLGGEANTQRDVGGFLRNLLNPFLHEFNCGALVIHHTNKPPKGKEKPDWQAGDFAYLGAGSAEWANWARAVLAVRSIGSHSIFQLQAAKRGGRIGWKEADGQTAYVRYVAHAKDSGTIYWREVNPDEVETGGRPKSYDREEIFNLLPDEGLLPVEWEKAAMSECGVSRATFHRERLAFVKAGRVLKERTSRNYKPVRKG
ncbi:MAG: hypothetical protein C5B50_24945 [Verrucomicrobia bacterium]|nr:MAG: hypothetical protein C5B50_24945 [Verrucomicrobiota bacterium]